MTESFGRVLAFVEQSSGCGPKHVGGWILESTGPFLEEVRHQSPGLADHDVPDPKGVGLLVFEGWLEYTSGPDPDVRWTGSWRRLTHWEMCKLRAGYPILIDLPPELASAVKR